MTCCGQASASTMGEPTGAIDARSGDNAAEALALTALAYLLEDPDRANRFLTATGMDGDALPSRLADPVFLGCILDFVLEDETLLVAVAGVAGLRADRVIRMRQRLPGALPPG
mgnify:CR=1 FL=1